MTPSLPCVSRCTPCATTCIILIENQIPLFVLDLLLGIQLGNPEQTGVVSNLVVRF
jgi:hypothetical protein